jgi:hypothetical protein
MRHRTHRHVIKFPIFRGYEVRVSFASDLKAEAARLNTDEMVAAETAFTLFDASGFCHIVLPHNPDSETIAHECFHAVWALMTWAGATLEDEVVAYHLGHIVGLVTKWSRRNAPNA